MYIIKNDPTKRWDCGSDGSGDGGGGGGGAVSKSYHGTFDRKVGKYWNIASNYSVEYD